MDRGLRLLPILVTGRDLVTRFVAGLQHEVNQQ